jgi:hypothetical protein
MSLLLRHRTSHLKKILKSGKNKNISGEIQFYKEYQNTVE